MNLIGFCWICFTARKSSKFLRRKKAMVQFAEHNQTGGTPCKIYPVTLCFVCPRYSRSFPSAAAHGGRAARAVVIRNPSNSARAQRRGGHRISPRFWRSSLPGRRKNESHLFPGSSSVTPACVPEAGIWSRPRPAGPLRGP